MQYLLPRWLKYTPKRFEGVSPVIVLTNTQLVIHTSILLLVQKSNQDQIKINPYNWRNFSLSRELLLFHKVVVSLAAIFSLLTQRSSPHSLPPFQPITIRVTYVENSARQSNLNNYIVCFILEFKAFKMTTFEEAFDVVSNTFRFPSSIA